MPKTKKKRFLNPFGDNAYRDQWAMVEKYKVEGAELPEFEEVEVVEVDAFQNGEVVKISVYADHVPFYERALESAQSDMENE